MIKYCYNCEKSVNVSIGIFTEEYPVMGEPTTINANVVVCSECGTKLWDNEYDNQNLITAFNEYRNNHGMLLPDEIKKIRLDHSLRHSDFEKLLGFKPGSVAKFEHGSLQTKDEDNAMREYDKRFL